MTRFEQYKNNLSVEQLASNMVKLVLVNGIEPYYVTSFGQLFPMSNEGFNSAIEHELDFWKSEEQSDSSSTSNDDIGEV